MEVKLWGVRGSVPTPGPETARYGGNTACVEVRGDDGSLVVLDAGTGISALGDHLPESVRRIDVLLTHLHMDHILGLGFFAGLYRGGLEVHLWGPASSLNGLRARLSRYLSPPLFPVRLRELGCDLSIHDVPFGTFDIPGFTVTAALVCHPGPTVGYRLFDGTSTLAYLPDHEPALGARRFPDSPRWTSGYDVAAGADLLVHDAQYTEEEYPEHVGWGHSTIDQALLYATAVEAKHLVLFHHDPRHHDDHLDALFAGVRADPALRVTPAHESATFVLHRQGRRAEGA
jgi:phosphoribosyl 1,2-cyclic phosphodiesterase